MDFEVLIQMYEETDPKSSTKPDFDENNAEFQIHDYG